MDAKSTTSTNPIAEARIVNKSRLNCSQLTAAAGFVSDDQAKTLNSSKKSHMSWTRGYLNTVIPNNDPISVANGSAISKTIENSTTDSFVNSRKPPNKVRPVSFSLPKRSCILLHQSAAIFIQAGRGKESDVIAQESIKSLREKHPDKQQLKSPITADEEVVDVDGWDSKNDGGMDCTAAEAGSIMSVERGNTEPCGHGAQASLNNCNEIGVEDSIIMSGAQFSLCKGNQTGIQVRQESETGACSNTLEETTHNVLNKNKANDPQMSVSAENPSVDSASVHPRRLKEPFCPVLNRDGSRVLLWPTEMLCYTKTSPTISYSINPLLYDFRAHNKAKEGVETKKGGLEEARERIKPCVIKQQGEEGREDERQEVDEGGEELEARRAGDDSPLKLVVPLSKECHAAPAPDREIASRRRKRRGGVRRGIRKRGRRRRGKKTDKKDWEKGRRMIGALCVNQMFEGRAEERLNREKGLLSNLTAHRLAGRGEKRMRGEKEWIKGHLAEQERASRNEEKRGELLSNFSVNRCNRCTQLCVEAKRDACLHLAQQSATGWDPELRKILSRGTACNLVISPNPGTAIETPRCPAITHNLPPNDSKAQAINKNAGKDGGSGDDREWRNPRMEEIRAQKVKENVCNLAISDVSSPCRDTEICLVPRSQSEAAACHPAIRPVPAPFREAACTQRQTIPTGHDNPVPSLTPRCSEADVRMGSPCAGKTLPAVCDVEVSEREEQRKRKLPGPGMAQKQRWKKGRQATKRAMGMLKQQRLEKASEPLTSDASVGETFCSWDLSAALEVESDDNETFLGNCSTLKDKAPECGPKHSQNKAERHSDNCSSSCNNSIRQDVGSLASGEKKLNYVLNQNRNEFNDLKAATNVGEKLVNAAPAESHADCSQLKPKAVLDVNALSERVLPHERVDTPIHDGFEQNLKLKNNKMAKGESDETEQQHRTPDAHGCDLVGSIQLDGRIRMDTGTEMNIKEGKEDERCKNSREKQEVWERVRRKEEDIDFDHLYPEKRPCFPHHHHHHHHHLPRPCIPLHILPPPSASSSFSFRHTIIQHHLSILPAPSHLPVPSYPHLFHLAPAHPPPPPPPPPPALHPSFYASPPIPLLEAPGPYPLAFHPVQGHHPSLFPPPHPAVLPLQVLF